MPTYEYLCENCGHKFDHFQSMTASVLRKCPECGKNKLRRLIGSGAGIIFKGSGFYQTDYRSESYKAGKKEANSSSTNADKAKDKNTTKDKDKSKPAESKPTESKPAESKPKPTAKDS